MDNKITDEFLRLYAKLEGFETSNNKLYCIIKNKYFNLFELFRKTRNVLAHQTIGKNEYPIYVNTKLVEELKIIIDKFEITAYQKSIRYSNIYQVRTTDRLKDILIKMDQYNYSYVPIIDDKGLLKGVITENSLLAYIVDNEASFIIDDDNTVLEIFKYAELANNKNERFVFISRDVTLYEVQKMFYDNIEDSKKLAAVFVTEKGKTNEKVIGMLTAWDVVI
ncbi:MAG: CBS domain-containing protein [Erysipelotrichaceae bacterium]